MRIYVLSLIIKTVKEEKDTSDYQVAISVKSAALGGEMAKPVVSEGPVALVQHWRRVSL